MRKLNQLHLARCVPYCLAVLFILSGLYKALDPADAISALMKLGARVGIAREITFGVAVAELYIAINLLRAKHQIGFARVAVYMLCIFTVFLLALLSKGARSCGCGALEPLMAGIVNPVVFGVFRNLLLIAVTEWYLWRCGRGLMRLDSL